MAGEEDQQPGGCRLNAAADAVESVREHWARRCGAPAECFRQPGTHASVAPDQRPERVTLFRAPRATLVALPQVPRTDAALAALGTPREALLDAEGVAALLPDWRLAPRYRDFILALPPEQATVTDHPHIHALDASDKEMLEALFAACDERERRAAQITPGDPFVMGYWQADRLLGASSLLLPAPEVADIGVLVRPQARRRGVATALVRQIAALAIRMGKSAQYCAADDNVGSLAVARRCGFTLSLVEEGLRPEMVETDRGSAEVQRKVQ